MQTFDKVASDTTPKVPWNKGKLLGAKPPLQTKQVWAIRTKLQVERRLRDLAMFNLAIDSKLRGCDLVSLKVEDVAPHGFALERATVRQRKTGHPVKFELTEQTREAIDAYMMRFGKRPGDVLFASRGNGSRCISTRQYARLLANWTASVGLDPRIFGTHSLRRTSCLDLSPDRQPPGRSAAARSHQDREHGPLSRDRG
jgi:integrase